MSQGPRASHPPKSDASPVMAAGDHSAHIQTFELSKSYKTTRVLDNISVSIPVGSITTILGASGCGKSTLLKIMAGLIPASEGIVLISGHHVTSPPREAIYIFQQYTKSVFPWMTVLENARFGLRHRETMGKKDITSRAERYLEFVGLHDKQDYLPKELSGGMQQRLAIARALACEPRLLLMDEPFSAVDALTRAELQDLLLEIWDRLGVTVLFVTHDIDEAVYISQRVMVLGDSPSGSQFTLDTEVQMGYPRDQIATRASHRYLELREQLHNAIKSRPKDPHDRRAR